MTVLDEKQNNLASGHQAVHQPLYWHGKYYCAALGMFCSQLATVLAESALGRESSEA